MKVSWDLFQYQTAEKNNVHIFRTAWCQTFKKGLSEIYALLIGNIYDIPRLEIHGHLPFTCNIRTLMCLHPTLLSRSKSVTQFPPHDLFPLLLIPRKLLFLARQWWQWQVLVWQTTALCPQISACEAFVPGRLDGRWGSRLILVSVTRFLQTAGECHYFAPAG